MNDKATITDIITQYVTNRVGKEVEYKSYEHDDGRIHQFWYFEDGVKYGQEYYRSDGESLDFEEVVEEIDSFPEVTEGTVFPRKNQSSTNLLG